MDSDNVVEITVYTVILAFVILFITAICMPHDFEGYYLYSGDIYAKYDWQPNERAFDYTEKLWQEILTNNLHVEKVE